MSEKLKQFIKEVGENPDKREKYRQDPETVMNEHELPEDHKDMVRKKDKQKVQDETGLDDAEVNMFIW